MPGVTPCATSLRDLLEVFDELCGRLGLTRSEVLATQRAKRSSRGGFEQLLYLEATSPEPGRLDESQLFPTSPSPPSPPPAEWSAQ